MTNMYRTLLLGLAIIVGIVSAGSNAIANCRITNSAINNGVIAQSIEISAIQQISKISSICCAEIGCKVIDRQIPTVIC